MSKYRKHDYNSKEEESSDYDIDDEDDGDEDDTFSSDDFNQSDLEIMNKKQSNTSSHQKQFDNGSLKRDNGGSDVGSDVNLYSTYFDDDEEMVDDDDEDTIDQKKNGLLQRAITPTQRAINTCNGIQLIVDNGRAKKDNPSCTVNISDWKPIYIVKAIDTVLRRYGTTSDNYTPFLVWDKQDHPEGMDWNDMDSLYIPWHYEGFHIFLSKIKRPTIPQKRRAGSGGKVSGEPLKKRRKKNILSNKQKKIHRERTIEFVMDHIGNECKEIIDNSNDKQLWYRVAWLHDRAGWSLSKIRKMIKNSHTQTVQMQQKQMKEIDDAQKDVNFGPKPSRSEVTAITKDIMGSTLNRTSTIIKDNKTIKSGIDTQSKYWRNMIREDMKNINKNKKNNKKESNKNDDESMNTEKEWNQRQIEELIRYKQELQNEMEEWKKKTDLQLQGISDAMAQYNKNHNIKKSDD